MTMFNEEAIELPKKQRQASSWIAIALMGIWVPILMIVETVIGIAIFSSASGYLAARNTLVLRENLSSFCLDVRACLAVDCIAIYPF